MNELLGPLWTLVKSFVRNRGINIDSGFTLDANMSPFFICVKTNIDNLRYIVLIPISDDNNGKPIISDIPTFNTILPNRPTNLQEA